MIRIFVYSLLALITGTVLSVLLGDDPGYILITFAGYSVETSVAVVAFIFLAVFILGYGLYLLLNYLYRLLKKSGVRIFNNKQRARTATENGFLLLSEGRFQEAYKLLLQNANTVESPLLNYLAASLAAFQDSDRKSWMYCLQQAEKYSDKDNNVPINSLKAFFEMKSGNVEQSLAMLIELRKLQPGNRYFLRMLKNNYLALQDWEQILLVLPDLSKHSAMSEEDIDKLYLLAGPKRLHQIAVEEDAHALTDCWESLPKKYRQQESFFIFLREKQVDAGDAESVHKQASRFLKRSWSDNLILLLGYLDASEPGELILWLEKYIKDRPSNATLALTLGRLCLRNRQWVKGREYFEKALRFSQQDKLTAEISAELGRLLDHLGEHERSVACYRNAMGMGDKKLPDLPMPL